MTLNILISAEGGDLNLHNNLVLSTLEGSKETEIRKACFTLLYLKQITNKDLLYSTGNPAQCCVPAWMGGEFGGEWMYVCV